MADLNLYDVDFGDFKTQMQLNEKDAEAYGDRASKVGSVEPTKAIPTHHGIQIKDDDDGDGEKKAEAPPNKSRSAANKSA